MKEAGSIRGRESETREKDERDIVQKTPGEPCRVMEVKWIRKEGTRREDRMTRRLH